MNARHSSLDRDTLTNHIASTLRLDPHAIEILRLGNNERGTAWHILFSAQGGKYFAKHIPNESVPLAKPVALPTDLNFAPILEGHRGAVAQLQQEREATITLGAVSGDVSVPTPEAMSSHHRTMVWRAADGLQLEDFLRRSRRNQVMAGVGTKACHALGLWLRKVHDSSTSEMRTLDLNAHVDALQKWAEQLGARDRKYVARAVRILEEAKSTLTTPVKAPLCFIHGDLQYPNVLLDEMSRDLTVVDFEWSRTGGAETDLVAFVANTRAKELNPSYPAATARLWEKAFWDGYGSIDSKLAHLVDALATAWIFYWYLPGLTRRQKFMSPARRGAIALFRSLVERHQVNRFCAHHGVAGHSTD